jgi:hypothetical protein
VSPAQTMQHNTCPCLSKDDLKTLTCELPFAAIFCRARTAASWRRRCRSCCRLCQSCGLGTWNQTGSWISAFLQACLKPKAASGGSIEPGSCNSAAAAPPAATQSPAAARPSASLTALQHNMQVGLMSAEPNPRSKFISAPFPLANRFFQLRGQLLHPALPGRPPSDTRSRSEATNSDGLSPSTGRSCASSFSSMRFAYACSQTSQAAHEPPRLAATIASCMTAYASVHCDPSCPTV